MYVCMYVRICTYIFIIYIYTYIHIHTSLSPNAIVRLPYKVRIKRIAIAK